MVVLRSIVRGVGLLAAFAYAGCDIDLHARSATSVRRPIPVHVEVVASERAEPALVVAAIVEPKSSRLLAFRRSGRIARFRVGDGERVAAGGVVAEFDLVELERAVDVARVAVARAQDRLSQSEIRHGRQQQLFELASNPGGWFVANRVDAEVQASELRYARLALAAAESRLVAGVLRAPFSGILERRYRDAGAFAESGEPVARLSELETVMLRAEVPLALLPLLHVGSPAAVRDGDGRRLVGSVERVSHRTAPTNGRVPFEVRVENPELVLRPSTVVELAVETAVGAADCSIPLAALQRGIDARPFSFVVVGDTGDLRVERRYVTVAGLRGDRVSVLAGLRPGERVVTLGKDLVTVGDAVTIVDETR